MTTPSIRDLFADAGRVNPSWTLGVGVLPELAVAPPGHVLRRATDLVSDPSPMVADHAQARGLRFGREAASLVFQRYSHRWCGIAVHALISADIALDLSAENCSTLFQKGSPVAVVPHHTTVSGRGAAATLDSLVDGHLLPLARSIREATGLGMANLWGNMAAAFALGFRMMSRCHDADDLFPVANDFMSRRPQLARGGRFEVLEKDGITRLFYHRTSCCHWHAVPVEGQYCTWCSRISAEERAARLWGLMDQEVNATGRPTTNQDGAAFNEAHQLSRRLSQSPT